MPSESEPAPFRRPPGGIFLTPGIGLRIPEGGLRLEIGEDGQLVSSSLTMQVLLDVCPHWLELMLDHLEVSEQANAAVMEAWRQPVEEPLRLALEAEFRSSMQCCTAAAVALDAFYANLKSYVVLPKSVRAAWRSRRTARYKQVTEVFRQAFLIGPRSAVELRKVLKEIFRFRDLAVHPPAEFQSPQWREDIELQTEWRFAAFRYSNARQIAHGALSMIVQLLRAPRPTIPQLVEYARNARERSKPLASRWEGLYGDLLPPNARPDPDSPPAA